MKDLKEIRYIDLFSGIGGFRLAFDRNGYKNVFSCDNNENAAEVYKLNFGDESYCDASKINPDELPEFELLLAGFPCQTFSIGGKQKGFYDTRGTMFFDIYRILERKKPEAFVLENVAHLEHHDKGRTFSVIHSSLEELGYNVSYKVLNAKDFGVPQNRRRIIIVGSLKGFHFDFDKLKTNQIDSMQSFLDTEGDFEYLKEEEYTLIDEKHVKKQESGLKFVGYRNKPIRTNGARPNTEHLSRVHRQPNRIYSSSGNNPTIQSQESSGRYWILTKDNRVRKLTMDECYRFMGFPDDFKRVGSSVEMYARIGNSVAVPMVEQIAEQVKKQFFDIKKESGSMDSPTVYLNNIYNLAIDDSFSSGLNDKQKKNIKRIAEYEESYKGVFTVLFTSLTYKGLYPEQDVRYHQANLKNGYSGRSFDTKYVTPFLKGKNFYGAPAESGWLTRSLETNSPYTLDYPSAMRNKKVKQSFLEILDDIEEHNANPEDYLKTLINYSVMFKKEKMIDLINPIEKESTYKIQDIIELLHKHFYYSYKSAGAALLPVVAIYSVYECLLEEMVRFSDKKLEKLGSHTSADLRSGSIGDIIIKDKDNNYYEAIEIKHNIEIDEMLVRDAYEKIKPTKVQRYYLLSTAEVTNDREEKQKIEELIDRVEKEHGCQIIVNGIFDSLKYYLRLLDDTDKFIDKYMKNLRENTEIKQEQKLAWNTIQS